MGHFFRSVKEERCTRLSAVCLGGTSLDGDRRKKLHWFYKSLYFDNRHCYNLQSWNCNLQAATFQLLAEPFLVTVFSTAPEK